VAVSSTYATPVSPILFFCQEGNAAVLLSDRKCVFLKVISAASALPRLLSTNAAADVMNN